MTTSRGRKRRGHFSPRVLLFLFKSGRKGSPGAPSSLSLRFQTWSQMLCDLLTLQTQTGQRVCCGWQTLGVSKLSVKSLIVNILGFCEPHVLFGLYSFFFLSPEKMYKPLLDRGTGGVGEAVSDKLIDYVSPLEAGWWKRPRPRPHCHLFSEQYGDFVSKLSGQPTVFASTPNL